MSDNDYDKAYEAGRDGTSYSGGNSIDYAGWAAGDTMRRQDEARREGFARSGSGSRIDESKPLHRPAQFAIGAGMLGMVAGFIASPTWTNGVLGFLAGAVVGVGLYLALQALRVVLRLLGFVVPGVIGFFVGALAGRAASESMPGAREEMIQTWGIGGAVLFIVIWALLRWRRAAR